MEINLIHGMGAAHLMVLLIYIYIYTHTHIYTLLFKRLSFKCFCKKSHDHQGCIYLIKNTVKTTIF